MTSASKPAAFYADFGRLATLKGAAKNQDPNALRETARQFESLFTQMMLKNMRQASDSLSGGESLMDNDQSKMYMEMFDNQLASQLSKGRGLGLADMLVKQLTQSGLAGGSAAVGAAKKADADSVHLLKSKNDGLELPDKSKRTSFPIPQFRAPTTAAAQSPVSTVPTASGAIEGAAEDRKDSCGSTLITPKVLRCAEAPAWTPDSGWQLPQLAPGPVTAVPREPDVKEESASVQPVAAVTAKAKEATRPQPLAKDAADFVRQLWPHAQKAARELGVDAKTLIAHAALETGWGKFVPCNPDGSCSFNLFGIKATGKWKGTSTAVNTLEYEDGIAVKKRASFRTYESAADSFHDYASFIKNSPRYAAAVGAGGDAAAFASALQQGGYATDPHYATKLASVAARLDSMTTPKISSTPLKLAGNQPLSTGRSVSTGDET